MIFMPKYGHPKRHLVTWAEYSMLIGRDQFCFAVIGQSLLEPLSLLSKKLDVKLSRVFNRYKDAHSFILYESLMIIFNSYLDFCAFVR